MLNVSGNVDTGGLFFLILSKYGKARDPIFLRAVLTYNWIILK